jgi:diguanylate cyclase (GGDEF)-like protein
VLLLVIYRFRVINDSLGHDVGYQLLLMFAERISAALGENDSAARFGGDEFAILCEGLKGSRGALDVARRIEHALSAPFTLGDETVFLRTTAGVALANSPEASPDSLLRDADSAMNRAKERGGGTLEVFEGTLHERAMRRLKVEHSLHTALERDELTLNYQPQFRIGGDEELYGTEALVRWNHPVRGVVGPDEFIGSAEETGLVVELGAWVLEQACMQALSWPVEMSVNVAARQCVQPGFVEQVDRVIEGTGIDPTRLCLELTETGPINDGGIALKVLTELKSRGISLAVDDFGTGYSSLQALRQLPFDVVKIDRSFIESIHTHQRDAAVVAAVVDLAHAIGLTVVAEGVEHQAQIELLLQMGCDAAQGFHLAEPAAARDLESRFALRS